MSATWPPEGARPAARQGEGTPMTGSAHRPLQVLACPLTGRQLIEASAGTGKTWAICALYLRLLLEQRHTVQQILVVTFTNAATAELRSRIRARLAEALALLRGTASAGGDPLVPDLLAQLRAQGQAAQDLDDRLQLALHSFDEAAVFTIHGFCQRALAESAFSAQMPLRQALLADDSDLRQAVVNDFWRRAVAGSALPTPLLQHLLAKRDSPQRWAELLKRQLGKPMARVVWPSALDAPAAAETPPDTAATAQAFAAAQALWASQRDQIVTTLAEAVAAGRLHAASYKPEGVASGARDWDALFSAGQPDAALSKPALLYTARLLAAKTNGAAKGKLPPAHAFFDAAQALADAQDALQGALTLARLRLLRQLLADTPAALADAKRARQVVAFDDMLANLHQRLQADGGAALAASLRQRYPAALIDEFQDTDPLQFAVFHRIHGTAAGDAVADAPPLFLVGDPKQAIYSFRHADLHTYLHARSLAASTHTLLANQRATRPLISALNHLFTANPQAFMQPGLAYHPVAFGAKPRPVLSDSTEPRAPLQLWTLRADSRSGQPLNKAQAMAAAAEACAGEITRLLTAAGQGAVQLGGAPLRAGDIAVLVRSHTQGSTMRQALARLGVGSVELSQASVFHSPDAEELDRLLTAVLSPARDGLVKAALATRAMGYNAGQIDALAPDETAQQDILQRLAGYQRAWGQPG
ncbi:MAG: exodeoxyribonuclease V subunit beta, partial [Burkholderiales bacterium PBB5]